MPRLRRLGRRQVRRRRLVARASPGRRCIDGSLAVVECRLGDIFDGGDHELVTGHVVAMEVGEGSPLLFYRSGFGRFAS